MSILTEMEHSLIFMFYRGEFRESTLLEPRTGIFLIADLGRFPSSAQIPMWCLSQIFEILEAVYPRVIIDCSIQTFFKFSQV